MKTAALYWDGMKRIVPPGARPEDSDEVKRLLDAGFIENHVPRPDAADIAQPFRELLDAYGPQLRERFSVHKSRTWPEDPYTAARHAGGEVDTALAYVFDDKIERHLLDAMYGYRLVTRRVGDPRWIGMHPRFAGLYMTALAEAMAPMLGAHPVTDQPFDHIAVSGITMERLAGALLDLPGGPEPAHRSREIEQAMMTLAFKTVIPADPAGIPAADIIAFRERYAEERGLFQAEVARLAGELKHLDQVDDPVEFTRHLENLHAKSLAPRLERLQKELRRVNIDTASAVSGMSFAAPTMLGWTLTSMGVPSAGPAGTALGIAFATWTICRSRQKARMSALQPSPQAYLYHAGRALTPAELTNEIYIRSQLFRPPSTDPS